MILEWREEKAKGVLEGRYDFGTLGVRGMVGGDGQHCLLAGCYCTSEVLRLGMGARDGFRGSRRREVKREEADRRGTWTRGGPLEVESFCWKQGVACAGDDRVFVLR